MCLFFLVLPWSSQHSKRRFLRRRIPTRHGSMHPAGCNVPWRQCVICHQWHNQVCRHKRLPSYNCHKVGLKVAISSMEGMCTKHILWPMYHEKHIPVVVTNIYALHGWSGTWWTMWRGLAASSMSLGGDSRTSFFQMVSQQYMFVDCCDVSKTGTGGTPPIIPHPNDQNCRRPCNWNQRIVDSADSFGLAWYADKLVEVSYRLVSPADIEEESKHPRFFLRSTGMSWILIVTNQVITKFLFILNTADYMQWLAFTFLASICLIWVCVYVQVFPRVLWLLDCFSLCEGVPKRKGLDIPIREMKATWIQRSIWWTPGWRSWLRRWMFHDFLCSWIRSSWIYDDLCSFVELEHTLPWDVLRYTVNMGVGRSVLCSWLECPGFFFKIFIKWFLMSALEYASGAVLKRRPRSSVPTWLGNHSSWVYCITWLGPKGRCV